MAIRGIERLKRVMWRLVEQDKEYYLKSDIELAIMYECGTDPRTVINNYNQLIKLGWFKISSKRYYIKDKNLF
ncbi:MAG: hypothetical protein ACOC5T_02935 [Elusimicrobiota bacterium]